MKKGITALLLTLVSTAGLAAEKFPTPIPSSAFVQHDCMYEGKAYSPGADIKQLNRIKTCQQKEGGSAWVDMDPNKAPIDVPDVDTYQRAKKAK